jgi:hypothetical protein
LFIFSVSFVLFYASAAIKKLMKKSVLFIFFIFFAVNVFAQNQPKPFDFSEYGIKIEPDKRLIVVMAALEAAGLNTKLSEDGKGIGDKFREDLRADLDGLNPDTRTKLKIFLDQYKRRRPKATSAEIAAPFVSLAYALGPTPELADPYKTDDLPGDLLEVFDFAPLVREFYRRSNIEIKLSRYMQIYNDAGDKMRPSARQMTLELLDYLHTRPQLSYLDRTVTSTKIKGKVLSKTEVRERERRFFIVPDLLAPMGTINFRNVGDDYYVVVPPNTNLTSSEARRAYLQFTFDALVLKNSKDITPFKAGIKELLAQQNASPDIFLAVIRSLVSAADAKQAEYERNLIATYQARQKIELAKGDDAKRAVFNELEAFKKTQADETALQLSDDYENGAVLAFYFAEQFKGLEDSGFDIAGSFRDMLLSLDTTKETNRLAQFGDARKRALQARQERRDKIKTSMQNSQAENTKEQIFIDRMGQTESVIKVRNYEKADKELAEMLKEFPEYQARILYAQGRVASLSATEAIDETIRNERLERAAAGYRNAISAAGKTEESLRSQAHVALGEILEFNEQFSAAIAEYDAAIKIGNVPKGAFQKASDAKARLTKKP